MINLINYPDLPNELNDSYGMQTPSKTLSQNLLKSNKEPTP